MQEEWQGAQDKGQRVQEKRQNAPGQGAKDPRQGEIGTRQGAKSTKVRNKAKTTSRGLVRIWTQLNTQLKGKKLQIEAGNNAERGSDIERVGWELPTLKDLIASSNMI